MTGPSPLHSIDRFIGMTRALGDLSGDCIATVVAACGKDIDIPLAQRVLAGTIAVDLTNDTEAAVLPAE